jgi:transposase-like protein
MPSRGTYRRHSSQFRLQLCQDIRSGAIGCRDAARHHNRPTNLLQLWLGLASEKWRVADEARELHDAAETVHEGI